MTHTVLLFNYFRYFHPIIVNEKSLSLPVLNKDVSCVCVCVVRAEATGLSHDLAVMHLIILKMGRD